MERVQNVSGSMVVIPDQSKVQTFEPAYFKKMTEPKDGGKDFFTESGYRATVLHNPFVKSKE